MPGAGLLFRMWPRLLAPILVAADLKLVDKLQSAREALDAAFMQSTPSTERIREGLVNLQEVARFVSRVIRSGWSGTLFDEQGKVEYQLSGTDQETVEAYMNEQVFVLPDLLHMVLMPPDDVAAAMEEESPRMYMFRIRLLGALRNSWWKALTANGSIWRLPFFGACANIVAKLHSAWHLENDPYRDLLLATGDDSIEDISKPSAHWKALADPILSSEYSRHRAFRHACAWLAIAGNRRQGLETAERHFRAFEHGSVRPVLEAAAVWPVFELLRALAARPLELRDDGDKALEPNLSPFSAPPQVALQDGGQSLTPRDALEMYRMVHIFGQLCNAYGVHWWVSHGTLIGALRDHGLSRHADDCEVDIPETDVEIFQGLKMRAALARNGYELSYDPRGRCFKIWPSGSPQAPIEGDGQLEDQTWWLPQRRVGTPALDVYILEAAGADASKRHYVSNEEFHCNSNVCTQYWTQAELSEFNEVVFGLSRVAVPAGAQSYLDRVYGDDWNRTVRPHRWAEIHGHGFQAVDVVRLPTRAAEPFGPLLPVVVV